MSTTADALARQNCQATPAGSRPLEPADCEALAAALDGWQVEDGSRLEKEFATQNFRDTMAFASRIAEIAEREDHHPDLHLSYRRLGVVLTTHSVGGLSRNDFILAAKIDQAYSEK
jgi:4a-hydroxytetrahydrobiopterin dehydratase